MKRHKEYEGRQGTSDWLEMRQNFLGSSDSPIIMEASPFKTLNELWEEKLGLRATVVPNAAMQRGLDLELHAREEFEKMTGIVTFPRVIFHPTIDYLVASLDGMSEDGEHIVEIKCPGKVDHALALKGKVPDKYIPQLMHQLEVSGLDMIHYFSFDGEKGVVIKVKRDQAYIDVMLEKEREFWDCVENLRCPTSPIPERDDEEWKELMESYQNAQKRRLEYEHIAERLKQEIISLTNEQEARGHGYKLVKLPQKGAVDLTKIPQLEGIDLDQFRKPATNFWKLQKDKS